MATEFTHLVRGAELALIFPLLRNGGHLLELGAGDGWQANELKAQGVTVTAVDIEQRSNGPPGHYPVLRYDGSRLPFADNSFDYVYSSNVLEHIFDLEGMQSELARVLRSGGIGIHCLPTATWRLWTTISHPVYVMRWGVRYLWNLVSNMELTGSTQASLNKFQRAHIGSLLRLLAFPPRHGERGNIFSEHWLFSKRAWLRGFSRAGWQVQSCIPTGLFYTGNELTASRLSIRTRRRLARCFGSSTMVVVARPPHKHGPAQ